MANFLEDFFANVFDSGSLEVETAGGRKFTAGSGPGPKLGLRFKDAWAPFLLMLDPEMK